MLMEILVKRTFPIAGLMRPPRPASHRSGATCRCRQEDALPLRRHYPQWNHAKNVRELMRWREPGQWKLCYHLSCVGSARNTGNSECLQPHPRYYVIGGEPYHKSVPACMHLVLSQPQERTWSLGSLRLQKIQPASYLVTAHHRVVTRFNTHCPPFSFQCTYH